MATQIREFTADELLRTPDDGMRRELVHGELREMPPAGGEHGRVNMRLASRLASYVERHELGVVFSADTGFWLERDPDTVRAPALAFVARENFTGGPGFCEGAPDLAVEVVSPSDRYAEVLETVAAYRAAGCRAVIVVDPGTRGVAVHRPRGSVMMLQPGDELAVEDVVPGWKLPVSDIFG